MTDSPIPILPHSNSLDFEPVPRQVKRPDGWDPERQRQFIALLAEDDAAARTLHIYVNGEPREMKVLFDDGPTRIEDVKTYELVGRLDAAIRDYSPAAVFTHSSSDFHNDHLLIYQACLPTQRLAYFDFFSYHPTNCRPVPVEFHANVYVDISDTIDAKMHAGAKIRVV